MRVLITGGLGFIGTRLATELLRHGTVAGPDGHDQPLHELVLLDGAPAQPHHARLLADTRVRHVTGDAADARVLQPLVAAGVDTVFVLGATLTTAAEDDVARGLDVNLLAVLRLLDACRGAGQRPRLVFTSSIAAFGGPLPVVVHDDLPLHPQTSYGTAKAMVELLLHDQSRHGFVDARCLRLPVVVVRPGAPGPSVSDRIAALVREPLRGQDTTCPLRPDTRVPLASVGAVARALLQVQRWPAAVFGSTRSVNLPALTVTLSDWMAAAGTAVQHRPWPQPLGRVQLQPDTRLQAVVDGWPQGLDSALARRQGLLPEASAVAIVQDFIDDLVAWAPSPEPSRPATAGPATVAATRHAARDDSAGDTPDICIIGAGSSGITVAKALLQQGLHCQLLEKGSQLGGMWRYENDNGQSSAYRSLHIDTSRKSLQYSDFPIPSNLPDFLSHWQVTDYLEQYARHFGVTPHVRFNTEVLAVQPTGDGRWQVSTRHTGDAQARTHTRLYRHVVVANGHLWSPRMATFAGTFNGQQLHAHHYRTPTPFEGQRVLVVGIGNSAVDIAVDLCRSARSVTLSTRRGAWVVPKYIMGVPTDRWSGFLARRFKLPTPWVRRIMGRLIYLAVGDQQRVGVPRPAHPIWREHACVSQDLLPYVGHGWIQIRPNVQELRGDHVAFDDGRVEPFDTVLYATGYKTEFPFIAPSLFEVPDGQARLYRRMVPPGLPGLYFAGLVQPIGPTVPLVEVQGRWLAAVLAGQVSLPDRAEMEAEIETHRRRQQRYVDSPRYTLEVDFREHAADLQRDLRRGRRPQARTPAANPA